MIHQIKKKASRTKKNWKKRIKTLRWQLAGKKAEKIFCIGRNKTGTTSLKATLESFGYDMGDQAEAELLVKHYAKGHWKPIIRYCKTAQAFQDAPFSWPYTWLILHEHFPNAKFILTTRDTEDWYRSQVRYHSKKFSADPNRPPTKFELSQAQYRYKGYLWDVLDAVWKPEGENLYSKDEFISNYERHNEDVRHFFTGKSNFIEIDLTIPEDFIRLVHFLGKDRELASIGFPHLNKTSS